MSLSAEQQGKVVALRAAGLSFEKIAAEVRCAKGTAVKVAADSASLVVAQRRELLGEIASTQRILLRDRLEALATLAGRVREELEKRPLGSVTTPTLVKLYTDLLRSIQDQRPLGAGDSEGLEVEDLDPIDPLEEILSRQFK